VHWHVGRTYERERERERRERKSHNNEVNLSVTHRRVNSVSGGLAPEFETFPVTSAAKPRARCAPSGAGQEPGAAGRRAGTKVSVCIKPPEATDCRF